MPIKESKKMQEHYFIQFFYYSPASHETEWGIIGEDNTEVKGEENAMLFDSVEEAEAWTETDEGKEWLPCRFEVKKSIY